MAPILFVCYINDLPEYCGEMKPFLFTDDTALLIRNKSMEVINDTLQCDFGILTRWLSANKLSLNIQKTKCMFFCGKRSPLRHFSLNISSNDIAIECVDTIKYLGVQIDRSLSFDDHVDNIVKKCNQRNRMLWKIRSFIPQEQAKYSYKTLIHHLFTYADFVYDGTSVTNQKNSKCAKTIHFEQLKSVIMTIPPPDYIMIWQLTISKHAGKNLVWK